jgi:hypothetical protein
MYLPDLSPFPSKGEAQIGLQPLAVGWLHDNKPFAAGRLPAEFTDHLLPFCFEQHSLPGSRHDARCALSRDCGLIRPLSQDDNIAYFDSHIRVIGEEDIFAAPALIYHYVTVHNYKPPDAFIQAILHGPQPGSPEHRALLKTLKLTTK